MQYDISRLVRIPKVTHCFQLQFSQTRLQWRGPRPDPRARVDGLTAASGGDGGRHGDPGAAGAEEEAEAAVGKVAVAAADAGGTAAAVAAVADECVG